MKGKRTKQRKRRPAVGDTVSFDFSGIPLTGVIVEDRGPLGIKERRLFGIRINAPDGVEPMYTERDVTRFVVVKRAA